MKSDGTGTQTRFRLSEKRTIPFKSAEASVQSTTGSRGVCISRSNAGYTMFRGSVEGTGYPLHSPVSHSLPLQCVIVCHHISVGVYSRHGMRPTTLHHPVPTLGTSAAISALLYALMTCIGTTLPFTFFQFSLSFYINILEDLVRSI